MTPVVTNETRSVWAGKALEAYKLSHKCDEDDQANIQDLITDLLHLARREHDMDYDALTVMCHRAAERNLVEQAEDPEDENDLCRTCGEPYEDGGDGYDGECPDCADKTDQKLHPENYQD